MFGYATDETEECMPLTVVLAHRLNRKIAELRRSGEFWWARPDSKTQVLEILSSYILTPFKFTTEIENFTVKIFLEIHIFSMTHNMIEN